MTTLSEHFKFYNTDDADAVATDIRSGKSAYINGGKTTGTQNHQGILLCWDFGGAIGTYTPKLSEAAVYHPDLTITNVGVMDRTAAGITANAVGNGIYFNNDVARTNARHYIATLDLDNTGFSDGLFDIEINWVDAAATDDAVLCRVIHNTATAWLLQIYEVTAGTAVSKASVAVDTAIQDAYAVFTVSDYGDTVLCGLAIWEKGGTTTVDTAEAIFYEASRTHKANTDFKFNFEQSKAIRMKQLMVLDV